MKMSQVSLFILVTSMVSSTTVVAKDCTPPTDGKVTFSFSAEGNTCNVEKTIYNILKPNSFHYSSSGATSDNFYYRMQYGCDSNGEWGVLPDGLQCEPMKNCLAESNIAYDLIERNGDEKINCKINSGAIPALASGADIEIEHGKVRCFHGELSFKPSVIPFKCPAGTIVDAEESNESGSSDSEVAGNESGNSSDESGNSSQGEGSDSLAGGGHGSNEQITAAAAAFGAAMSDKCEAGAKVKSLNTYTAAFKSYHSLVLKNVEIHEKGLIRMEQRSKELLEQAQNNETSLVQVESLKFQRDSIQLMIDLYMNDNTGTYKGKVNLLTEMTKSQEEALNEFKAMNKSILTCDGQTAQALNIAQTGCQRTKIVETCNDDGTGCVNTVVRDPVEGSCLALEMIPQSLKIKEELYNLQFEVMPSNLLVTGLENIAKNYIRFVSSSIPSGGWQGPLISCGKVLDQSHIDYGVKCETPQGDIANGKEWGVPVEGRLISDLYAGILGRLPDTGGDDYWQSEYDRIIASGKTAEEATAEIRNHIANSNENRGIEDTEEEKQRRLDSNKERGIVSVRCEDATCGRSEEVASSFDADKWYSSIEEQARFENLVNSEEGQISVDELKELGFDKFEKADLLVGAPYGRMELIPQMSELITQSVKEDLKVVEELTKNKNEIIAMLNSLESESTGTSTAVNGSGSLAKFNSGYSSSASLSKVEQTTRALSPFDSDSLLKSVASASAISDKLNNESEGALKKFEAPKSILNKSKPILEEIQLSNKGASRGSYNINARKVLSNSSNKTNENKSKADKESVSELDLNKLSSRGITNSRSHNYASQSQSPSSSSTTDATTSTNSASSGDSFGSSLTGMDFSGFDDNNVIPIHDRDKVKKLRRSSSSSYSNSGRMPSSVARGNSRRGGSLSSGQSQLGSGHGMQRGNTYSVDNSNEINKAGTSLFKIISKRYASSKLYPKK